MEASPQGDRCSAGPCAPTSCPLLIPRQTHRNLVILPALHRDWESHIAGHAAGRKGSGIAARIHAHLLLVAGPNRPRRLPAVAALDAQLDLRLELIEQQSAALLALAGRGRRGAAGAAGPCRRYAAAGAVELDKGLAARHPAQGLAAAADFQPGAVAVLAGDGVLLALLGTGGDAVAGPRPRADVEAVGEDGHGGVGLGVGRMGLPCSQGKQEGEAKSNDGACRIEVTHKETLFVWVKPAIR